MGFLDSIKSKSSQLSGDLKTQVGKFKSKDFAEASMATCALIAAADGSIDASERAKTASFIGSNDVLSVFNAGELRTSFDKWCAKLNADLDFGKIEAIQTIGKLRSKPDQARAVVQVGLIIGAADGNFDSSEKAMVRQITQALGLDPAEFGV